MSVTNIRVERKPKGARANSNRRRVCTPGTVSIPARKHTPAQVFLRFDLVGDRHVVRLSRLFELGQGFAYESVRQPVGIRIAPPAVGTVHVDQTQRAAVRTAQEQDRSSGSGRRIDGDLAIRRGVYFETPGRGSVHGVQQPARVSQRLSGRRRKPLFARFVPRLVQIEQGIAQVRMNDRRLHEGYIDRFPPAALAPCSMTSSSSVDNIASPDRGNSPIWQGRSSSRIPLPAALKNVRWRHVSVKEFDCKRSTWESLDSRFRGNDEVLRFATLRTNGDTMAPVRSGDGALRQLRACQSPRNRIHREPHDEPTPL